MTVRELQETIDEMQVDEWSKGQLYSMLAEQTNLRDMMMTDDESAAAGSDSVANNTVQVGAGASAPVQATAQHSLCYGLANPV